MSSKLGLFKCVVLLNLVLIHSFELFVLKNKNENQLKAKLLKILDQDDDRSEEIENHIARRRNEDHDSHSFERKRLIKTIVPHGQEVNFHTDGDANYKPLIRIHKKNKPNIKENHQYKIHFGVGDATRHDVKHAGDVSRFWQNLKDLKNKHNEKDTRMEHLKGAEPLRSNRAEDISDSDEVVTPRPHTTLSAYPFWNYWTYDKTLPEQTCNGSLIRYGDKCIGNY